VHELPVRRHVRNQSAPIHVRLRGGRRWQVFCLRDYAHILERIWCLGPNSRWWVRKSVPAATTRRLENAWRASVGVGDRERRRHSHSTRQHVICKHASLLSLSPELIEEIALYLRVRDSLSLALSCRRLRNIVSGSPLLQYAHSIELEGVLSATRSLTVFHSQPYGVAQTLGSVVESSKKILVCYPAAATARHTRREGLIRLILSLR
jgi:hypothetical protein